MARYMTKREAMRKRAWFRALSGLADFFASIGSVIVILLCVALLTQLFVWLRSDITQALYSLESVAISAIVQPDTMKEKEAVDVLPAAPSLEQATPAADDTVIPAEAQPTGYDPGDNIGEYPDDEDFPDEDFN